jgi:hypothetical protein
MYIKRIKDIEDKKEEFELLRVAERMVAKNLKHFVGNNNDIYPEALKNAKILTRREIMIIIEELQTYHQGSTNGIERLDYWLKVKSLVRQV